MNNNSFVFDQDDLEGALAQEEEEAQINEETVRSCKGVVAPR